MRERDYYERLISESLDRELSKAESDELEKALKRDQYLARFLKEMVEQAGLVRSLPEFELSAPLNEIDPETESFSPFRRWWKVRVSVPLPIAALLVVAFLTIGVFNFVTIRLPKSPGTDHKAERANYVQVERLRPVSAVLIEDSRDDEQFPEEEL